MSRRVAVIGMGAVAASGAGVDGFWDSLLEARSGVRPFARYDMRGFPVQVAAPVEAPFASYCAPCPWKDGLLPRQDRTNERLLAAAVAEALRDCGWLEPGGTVAGAPGEAPPARRGFYSAVRPEEDESSFRALAAGRGSAMPLLALRIARDLELSGPHLSLHDACTSGTALIGEALHDLRDGVAELALVAAANADLTLDTLCHYTLLSALSPGAGSDASRPFDARRDGFVRAEGGAAVVLAAWDDAEQPVPAGAQAEVVGYGASADAYRPTAGHPEERGLVLAIERCLADAGIAADDVRHVNAHGTGTRMNDLHEARALHRVLGPAAAEVPLTANKAVTGHASFASGLLEAVCLVRTLVTDRIPPTAHHEVEDPELPALDIVSGAPRQHAVANGLSLSSAFGGLNAAILLRRL